MPYLYNVKLYKFSVVVGRLEPTIQHNTGFKKNSKSHDFKSVLNNRKVVLKRRILVNIRKGSGLKINLLRNDVLLINLLLF